MKPAQQRRLGWLRHAIERRSASTFGILTVVVLGAVGGAQVFSNVPVVLGIVAVVLYEFQKRLDQGVPLLQLTSLIAVLQWLLGPLLNYYTDLTFGRYQMYVPEETYFRYALPGTALFVAIMLVTGASVRQKQLLQYVDRRRFVPIGILLNVIAVAATFVSQGAGGGMQFFLHLVSQLCYVGALYFLFSTSPIRLVLAGLSCVPLVSGSLEIGMFHDLILWLAIIFCYWFAQRRWTFTVKCIILATASAALFCVQVVKQDYRDQLKRGEDPSIVSLLISYLTPGGQAWETETLSLAITRLNQGWIISAVMNNVPEHEPFADGETVREALLSSLAPRILWSDKKTAGGRENFRRFTGLPIQNSTSMAISPLGEAYANFGVGGGIVFMMIFGAFIALFYYGTLRYVMTHPTFLFWIPLIFYQAMKAETELVVIINQLTKGAVVAFAFHYFVQLVLPVRLRPPVSASGASMPVVSQAAIAAPRSGARALIER